MAPTGDGDVDRKSCAIMSSLIRSITSFFSNQRDGTHIRRDQAMSSIDDAFSVPPGSFSSHARPVFCSFFSRR